MSDNTTRDENFFEDAGYAMQTKKKKKKEKKKKRKKVKRGDHICDCGAFTQFNTTWKKWHDDDCIINLKGKRK